MPEIQRKGRETVMVQENKQKNMFWGDFLLPRSPTGQNGEKGQHRDFDVCFNCQHLWYIFMSLSLFFYLSRLYVYAVIFDLYFSGCQVVALYDSEKKIIIYLCSEFRFFFKGFQWIITWKCTVSI